MNIEKQITLRRVFKNASTGPAIIQELFQMIFLAELLSPSDRLFIVSPWIGNVKILDNRAGGFDALNPEWSRQEIRLIDIALQLMVSVSQLVVVTRPDKRNAPFIDNITERAKEYSLDQSLHIIIRDTLHTKGILSDNGLLLGSMNLTYYGFVMNDEVIEYDISEENIAKARLSFMDYLG
jgi:hypothetical protein